MTTRRALPTLLLIGLLTACGSQTAETPPPPAAAAPAPAPAAPATGSLVPGADAQLDAAAAVWTTVFDSSAPVADKLPHLADPEGLEQTLTAYAEAAKPVWGIVPTPTAVAIGGDTANRTYDVTFAGNPAYRNQKGTLQRAGDGWQVSREQFRTFMAQARTTCPA